MSTKRAVFLHRWTRSEDDRLRVSALVGRLALASLAAEAEADPIVLPDGSAALVELQGVRWSMSAGGSSSVIRAAAIALAVQQVDEVRGRD